MWVILGPTNSGKTSLAELLKDTIGGQLVNIDAFQVYKEMDIGTAKSERKSEYEMIDLINPNVDFGVGAYIQSALPILNQLYNTGISPIIVGGSGLYARALTTEFHDLAMAPNPLLRTSLNELFDKEGTEGLVRKWTEIKAEHAIEEKEIDLKNPMRVKRAIERALTGQNRMHFHIPPFIVRKFAIMPENVILNSQILSRIDKMMQNGWIEEVLKLKSLGYGLTDPGMRAHGYRALYKVTEGKMTIVEARERTYFDVRQYAKRQRTWLRKEPELAILTQNGVKEQLDFILNSQMGRNK